MERPPPATRVSSERAPAHLLSIHWALIAQIGVTYAWGLNRNSMQHEVTSGILCGRRHSVTGQPLSPPGPLQLIFTPLTPK